MKWIEPKLLHFVDPAGLNIAPRRLYNKQGNQRETQESWQFFKVGRTDRWGSVPNFRSWSVSFGQGVRHRQTNIYTSKYMNPHRLRVSRGFEKMCLKILVRCSDIIYYTTPRSDTQINIRAKIYQRINKMLSRIINISNLIGKLLDVACFCLELPSHFYRHYLLL